MRHSLLNTVGNVVWVARNEREQLVPLLATYVRLKFRGSSGAEALGGGVRQTRILEMQVQFFDDYWLIEMFEEIFLRRHYFFQSSNTRPLIIDVGSNIGLSVLYFKSLFPDARVVAFEPDPDAFRLLEANAKANHLRDVELVNKAAYDGADSIELFGAHGVPGSPQASTSSRRAGGRSRTVPAARLSQHLSEPVDFLKLDVEGAERVIIDDLDRSGKFALVRQMAIEYHHHVSSEEDLLGEALTTLERNGFGYQLESRIPPLVRSGRGEFQNVLIRAYSKSDPRSASLVRAS
jgi:FkbM family methyltransferase